jgi:hypothetical protein
LNLLIHPGTCRTWWSGDGADCNCCVFTHEPWSIRHDPAEQFPWRIWRLMNDDTYEPLMRCSTFAAATQLIEQLQQLRLAVLKRDSNV